MIATVAEARVFAAHNVTCFPERLVVSSHVRDHYIHLDADLLCFFYYVKADILRSTREMVGDGLLSS